MDQGAVLDALLASIRVEAGDHSLDWIGRPEPLAGGFWAQMWRVRLTGFDDELVARVMPDAFIAARETAVQRQLADRGYPTPRVRLAAGPGRELDRAWMLMDLAPGKPLLSGLSGPAAIARLPRIARGVPDRLARHAATLHGIEPLPRTPEDETTSFVQRLRDQAVGAGRADLGAVGDRLAGARPTGGRTVICHGDLHPFNVLTSPIRDTVLDWSAALITDPAYDVAFTRLLLAEAPLTAPPPLRRFIDAAGRAVANRFTSTYDALAPARIDPGQLAWFTELHVLRIRVQVATWQAEQTTDAHRGHPFLTMATAGSLRSCADKRSS